MVSPPVISISIFVMVIRMLAIMCSNCPDLAVLLLKQSKFLVRMREYCVICELQCPVLELVIIVCVAIVTPKNVSDINTLSCLKPSNMKFLL